jgi:Protein of unknown function (DUF4240)
MPDEEFWAYIDLLGGRAVDVEPLVAALTREEPQRIKAFANTLARHLHKLDLFALFRQPVREPDEDPAADPMPLSDDGFLYARCAVVAAGLQRYEQVLADHAAFAGTWSTDGEALLYAAEEAWARRTGRDACEWEHEDPVSVETGSNRAGGWPEPDFNTHPYLVSLRQDNLNFVPPTVFHTLEPFIEMAAAPQVRDEAEALLHQHGGLPHRLVYIDLHLLPADYWDLTIVRRDWPMDMGRRDEHDWREVAPYHRQLAIVTNRLDATPWSVADQARALRGLAGYLLADDLSRNAPQHGAIPTLRQWRHDATDILPATP